MSKCENSLYLADCLDLLKNWHDKGSVEFIDLIYIDPPFNSNHDYNVLFESDLAEEAFKDTWSSTSYLDEIDNIAALSPKLYEILKLLDNLCSIFSSASLEPVSCTLINKFCSIF